MRDERAMRVLGEFGASRIWDAAKFVGTTASPKVATRNLDAREESG